GRPPPRLASRPRAPALYSARARIPAVPRAPAHSSRLTSAILAAACAAPAITAPSVRRLEHLPTHPPPDCVPQAPAERLGRLQPCSALRGVSVEGLLDSSATIRSRATIINLLASGASSDRCLLRRRVVDCTTRTASRVCLPLCLLGSSPTRPPRAGRRSRRHPSPSHPRPVRHPRPRPRARGRHPPCSLAHPCPAAPRPPSSPRRATRPPSPHQPPVSGVPHEAATHHRTARSSRLHLPTTRTYPPRPRLPRSASCLPTLRAFGNGAVVFHRPTPPLALCTERTRPAPIIQHPPEYGCPITPHRHLLNPKEERVHTKSRKVQQTRRWCQYSHATRCVARRTSLDLSRVELLLLPTGARRSHPVEVVEQARERQLHVGQPERHAWAHPAAGAEGGVLEVGAPEVDAAPLEPLRPERLGVGAPVRGVPRDRPRVHQHLGAPGHVPSTRHGSRHSRGSRNGTGVCRRSVSFTTRGRYRSLAVSGSVSLRWPSKASRSSVWAFRITRGFRVSSVSAHSSDVDEVSLPAAKISWPKPSKMIGMRNDEHALRDDGGDDVGGERALSAAVPLQPQQHGQQVVFVAVLHSSSFSFSSDCCCSSRSRMISAMMPRTVRAHCSRDAEAAHQTRRRVQVGQVEAGEEHHGPVELAQELVAPCAPPADGRSHHDVVHRAADPLADVHHRGAGAGVGDGAEEGPGFLLPDAAEGLDAARGEELQHADPAELAPQVAVGGEEDVPAPEAEHVQRRRQVPAGEGRVVSLHHLPGRLGRGHHQRRHGAHAEQHQRAVPAGQLAQGPVREVAVARQEEVVEAADEWQLPWPRRQTQLRRRWRGVVLGDELDEEQG
ncbi:LOW QUALITY PROTEIN: hypothetical protein U9M48_009535, partial [Paspalum notatum var. saurae]